MASLIFADRYNEQPQHPVSIDDNNVHATGVIVATYATPAGHQLVTPGFITQTAATPEIFKGGGGGAGVGLRGGYVWSPAFIETPPFSVLLSFVPRSLSTNGLWTFGVSETNTSPRLLIGIEASAGLRVYFNTSFPISLADQLTLNKPSTIVFTHDGTTGTLYTKTGKASATAPMTSGIGFNWYFGSGYAAAADAAYSDHIQWCRTLSETEARSLIDNPYQIYRKPTRVLYFDVGGGGAATGSLAATESGSDTASFSGDVYISGSLSVTETGSDTASFAGDVFVAGTLAATESGTDTAAFTGSAVGVITGTLSATESGSDTAAIAGDVYVSGTMAATETGNDTAAITGSLLVHGTLATTESGFDTAFFNGSSTIITSGAMATVESGADTAAVTGKVVVAGTMASSESGQDTATIAGDVLVSGTLAATETGQDTSSISGNVRVAGSLSATETGSDTAVFIGTGAAIRTGTLAASESGQDSASMAGRVSVLGELAAFEVDLDQAHFTNSAEIFGALSATETGLDTAAFRPKEFVTPGWTIYGLPRSWRIAS